MKFKGTVQEIQSKELEIEISPGELWANSAGYVLKVLDVAEKEAWCEWENGLRGSFSLQKMIEVGYHLVVAHHNVKLPGAS